MKYETKKKSTVLENVRGGAIKDVRLQGRTLVNISEINKHTLRFGNYAKSTSTSKLKPNTLYTIILNVVKNTLSPINAQNHVSAYNETSTQGIVPGVPFLAIPGNYTGINVFTFTTPSNINSYNLFTVMRTYGATTSGELEIEEIILEGDHTQAPPDYFEGLKSVGEGSDVMSLSTKGINLFDFNNFITKGDVVSYNITSSNSIDASKISGGSVYEYVGYAIHGLTPGVEYVATADVTGSSNPGLGLKTFPENTALSNDILPNRKTSIFRAPNNGSIRVNFYPVLNSNGSATMTATNISIVESKNKDLPYEPSEGDNRIVMYEDTDGIWKKPILREWDTIENEEFTEASGQVVLTGDESGYALNSDREGYIQFTLRVGELSDERNSIISNKLPTLRGDAGETGIWMYGGINFVFHIAKSSLATADLNGFRNLLRQWNNEGNPLTIAYKKTQPKKYKAVNTDLMLFEPETLLIQKTGYINSSMSFTTTETLVDLSQYTNDIAKDLKSNQEDLRDILLERRIELKGDERISELVREVKNVVNFPPGWKDEVTARNIDRDIKKYEKTIYSAFDKENVMIKPSNIDSFEYSNLSTATSSSRVFSSATFDNKYFLSLCNNAIHVFKIEGDNLRFLYQIDGVRVMDVFKKSNKIIFRRDTGNSGIFTAEITDNGIVNEVRLATYGSSATSMKMNYDDKTFMYSTTSETDYVTIYVINADNTITSKYSNSTSGGALAYDFSKDGTKAYLRVHSTTYVVEYNKDTDTWKNATSVAWTSTMGLVSENDEYFIFTSSNATKCYDATLKTFICQISRTSSEGEMGCLYNLYGENFAIVGVHKSTANVDNKPIGTLFVDIFNYSDLSSGTTITSKKRILITDKLHISSYNLHLSTIDNGKKMVISYTDATTNKLCLYCVDIIKEDIVVSEYTASREDFGLNEHITAVPMENITMSEIGTLNLMRQVSANAINNNREVLELKNSIEAMTKEIEEFKETQKAQDRTIIETDFRVMDLEDTLL